MSTTDKILEMNDSYLMFCIWNLFSLSKLLKKLFKKITSCLWNTGVVERPNIKDEISVYICHGHTLF